MHAISNTGPLYAFDESQRLTYAFFPIPIRQIIQKKIGQKTGMVSSVCRLYMMSKVQDVMRSLRVEGRQLLSKPVLKAGPHWIQGYQTNGNARETFLWLQIAQAGSPFHRCVRT